MQLIRRRGFSSGTRSAGFQACPCFSNFLPPRRHLPRALLRLKRRAGRDFMDRRAKAESLRPHPPHEKCEQGGTPDDVRTVKRRKRRAPNSSRAARLSACGRSPPAAVPHLRQRQKFQTPWLRCCRCDRGPVALHCGCGSAALYDNPAKSSRAARLFPGAPLCARSTSRNRLAAREAPDFAGRPRRFAAAAGGPRRTQPRSLGAAPPPCVHCVSLAFNSVSTA